LLIDIGMRHGMSEWLLMQLEERGDHTDMLRDQVATLRMKVAQLEKEIEESETDLYREQQANDALQAQLYDRESHGY
jgi:septal ring factor EnvC (AmiA/AmiB activator)